MTLNEAAEHGEGLSSAASGRPYSENCYLHNYLFYLKFISSLYPYFFLPPVSEFISPLDLLKVVEFLVGLALSLSSCSTFLRCLPI
jgi:hypothetical protein